MPAEPVETWVWQEVSRLLKDPDLVDRESTRLLKAESLERLRSERVSTQRRIKKIEGQQRALMRQLREGQGVDRLFELARAEISSSETERQHHLKSLATIDQQIAQFETMAGQLHRVRDFCGHIAARLDVFEFDDKRKSLEALAIEVTGDGRVWSLKGGIPVDEEAGISSTSSS